VYDKVWAAIKRAGDGKGVRSNPGSAGRCLGPAGRIPFAGIAGPQSLRLLRRDFFVQSPTWKLGAVAISILRRQYDKTYIAAAFDNNGHAVTLNFVLVNGPDGWVITDVESPRDSLRMFLAQYKN
jgi:hypothetical protein